MGRAPAFAIFVALLLATAASLAEGRVVVLGVRGVPPPDGLVEARRG